MIIVERLNTSKLSSANSNEDLNLSYDKTLFNKIQKEKMYYHFKTGVL